MKKEVGILVGTSLFKAVIIWGAASKVQGQGVVPAELERSADRTAQQFSTTEYYSPQISMTLL